MAGNVPRYGLLGSLCIAALAVSLASCDSTEEDTSQAAAEAPTASDMPKPDVTSAASPSTEPTTASAPRTPRPGETLYRWANLELLISDGSGIEARLSPVNYPGHIQNFMIVKGDPNDSTINSSVVIDGENGAIVEEYVLDQHRDAINGVLETLNVAPFDRTTAPWPYSGSPPPDLIKKNGGGFTYLTPSPATGLYVGGGIGDPGGAFIDLRNERSVAFVQRHPLTGQLTLDSVLVVEEDKPAFERWLATIQPCDETTC